MQLSLNINGTRIRFMLPVDTVCCMFFGVKHNSVLESTTTQYDTKNALHAPL